MNYLKALDEYWTKNKRKTDTFVFLAGPVQGAPAWRDYIIDNTIIDCLCWISPERLTLQDNPDFNVDEQADWETRYLRISDAVLFWIPLPKENINGRDYAQTTRIEFGENIARGKKIFFGMEKGIKGYDYLKYKAEQYNIEVKDNLNELLDDIKQWQGERITYGAHHKFFTSDTHFGSQRALELSTRPFDSVHEMDWTMIERWNKIVPVDAVVYHLGDFGDPTILKYLNGFVNLVTGNYEYADAKKAYEEGHLLHITKDDNGNDIFGNAEFDEWMNNYNVDYPFNMVLPDRTEPNLNVTTINNDPGVIYYMTHDPYNISNIDMDDKSFGLFGHIHGRQYCKRFGIDVGVDAHNFTPISDEQVLFYKTAIRKFYDKSVFC